ncbi:MAG: hypothetical protein H6Q22_1268 [Bacteroidetes bacterium]|nr:hypothetical protein [Bacteroidota bacterium]
MVNFYSQHGEDVILNELFKGYDAGFFVEIGCIDGRRFSNTLTFEERGWRGLCVEAHADYIELLTRNRPNSIVCHCAVGEEDAEDVTFYANSRGSLSTLERGKEDFFRQRFGRWFTGFKQQKIQKRRMDTIFRANNLRDIDILSLDIEGYEAAALRGLNLNEFRPRVFVIEVDSKEDEIEIDRILIPKRYRKMFRLAQNVFYLSPEMPSIDKIGRRIKAKVIHTQHPLDSTGDQVIEIELIL